jgi:hypothetical protein
LKPGALAIPAPAAILAPEAQALSPVQPIHAEEAVMVSTIVNVHIGYDAGSPLDFTQTHRIYAERHGYEYRQITRTLIPDALPTWSKHPAALAAIDDRDAVMIIDSDAQILETCPPFDQVVTDNHRYDLFLVLGHSFRPNAGLILLRGGPSSVAGDFLRTLLAERLMPPTDHARPGGDNGHVISVLRRAPFRDKLFILAPTWNNTMKACDWDHIRHYTGPMRDAFLAAAEAR